MYFLINEEGCLRSKIVFFIITYFFIASINVYATPPQERMFGNTLVKSGTSTKNIMPLLANIAGRQGKYLKSIYGQYRYGHIIVNLESNRRTYNVKEMEKVIKKVLDNIMTSYPSSEGEVSLDASDSDYFRFQFKNGRITKDSSIHFNDE